MNEQKYTTNLTEQQYRSNYGRVVAFADRLRIKLKNREIEVDEYRNDVLLYARKLNLLIKKDINGKDQIVSTEEIFGYKETDPIKYKAYEDVVEKIDYPSEIKTEVIIPKGFVTVGERNAPCQIVYIPHVR